MKQQTISRSDCDMHGKVDFIQQPTMTSSVAGPRRSSTELSKTKLAPKKWSRSLFGGLMLVWSTTAFWILVKPLHLRSMLSKSMRCMENCNACSWYWSKEWARSLSQQCLTSHTTNASTLEWIGLWSFATFAIFTWPLTNRLPLLQASWQLFAGKVLPQPAGGRKCFPRICQIPKHKCLC